MPTNVESSEPVVTGFYLEQNYPNPFNPTTKIKYQIPLSPPLLKGESEAGGFVTLKVYDILGNEIATLVNEEKPAGTYEITCMQSNCQAAFISINCQVKGNFNQTKKCFCFVEAIS